MLTKNELLSTYGGAINYGVITLIVSGIIFLVGVIDGYLRPLKCN